MKGADGRNWPPVAISLMQMSCRAVILVQLMDLQFYRPIGAYLSCCVAQHNSIFASNQSDESSP